MALIYPEGESPEVLLQKPVTLGGGKKPHSHLKRDVDVLSNRCERGRHENNREKILAVRGTSYMAAGRCFGVSFFYVDISPAQSIERGVSLISRLTLEVHPVFVR